MADPLLSPPVLLGSGGDNGALIEHFSWNSIYEAPSGGGGSGGSGGGGGLPVDGPLGLRTPGDENYFRFYSRRFGTTELQFMLEIFIPSGSRFGVQRWLYFPILPDPQVGLRLAPDEELYVGLKYKAPAPGIIVSLRGGYY